MSESLHILGFAGSLRKGSFNRAALRAAQLLVPDGVELEIFDLEGIPPYNADVEAQGAPAQVQEFKQRIIAAGALLIVTPEYNYSFSGVIKNAIDWASRPPAAMATSGKPAAIMGVSRGYFGTVRAQMHLRQVLFAVEIRVLPQPEVYIPRGPDKFDADGNLIDERTEAKIKGLLEALVSWSEHLKGF